MVVLINHLFFLIFFLIIFILSSATISFSDDCVYTIYVQTGWIIKGGTDSIISLRLYDSTRDSIYIPNVEAWGGLMGRGGHDYFERGNLDIFTGRGKCLETPVCAMNLTSNGWGSPHHGWFCNYIQVTSTGPHVPCTQHLFPVEQWLAQDVPPFDLTALRSSCPDFVSKSHRKLFKRKTTKSRRHV